MILIFSKVISYFAFCFCDKQHNQKQLGEEIVTLQQRGKLCQYLMMGASVINHTGMLLSCLLNLSCSAVFPIQLRPTHLGIILSTEDWALLHQLTIKKMPHIHV